MSFIYRVSLLVRLIARKSLLLALIIINPLLASEPVNPGDYINRLRSGAPSLFIYNVWVQHDTHKTVEPWWETGTPWEGKPAMTVYTQLATLNLQNQTVNLQVSFVNAGGELVRWKGEGGYHWTAADGVR